MDSCQYIASRTTKQTTQSSQQSRKYKRTSDIYRENEELKKVLAELRRQRDKCQKRSLRAKKINKDSEEKYKVL